MGIRKILINTEKYLTKSYSSEKDTRPPFTIIPERMKPLYPKRAGYIEFEDRKEYFGKNDSIRIKPLENHTIVAMKNTILHEISTPHPDDTVRVKDYYNVR